MRKVRKVLFIILGTIFVILGLMGVFFPVLPTTPFLLLAAYFFTRSSDRALQWLLNNRLFGAYIRNYREGRGMAVQAKAITLLLLWITIGATAFFVVENAWVRFTLFGIAAGVTIHLLRIKTYTADRQPGSKENVIEID